MSRFHSKLHSKNHHTNPSSGYPESASDPIASSDNPFEGDFNLIGTLVTENIDVSGVIASLSVTNIDVDNLIVNNAIANLTVDNLIVTATLDADGSGLTNVDAETLDGLDSNDFLKTSSYGLINGTPQLDGFGQLGNYTIDAFTFTGLNVEEFVLTGDATDADTFNDLGVDEFVLTADTAEYTVIVKQASDLAGTLSSELTYYIDGIIDMGSQSIEVPVGGLSLVGSTFDTSQLITNAATYTLLTSPVGGSGNVLVKDLAMTTNGPSSQVFDLVGATGFEAIEFERVNWNDCTSMGEIDNYRQGLESGTGRFGGRPSLTLTGTWLGGFFIDNSIVRSLNAGMTTPLYKAGAGFSMASRFRSNQNIDLPALAAFTDFAPSNFTNPSTIQLEKMLISRNGTFDPEDSNLTPNLTRSDLECSWKGNQGLPNTFVGGTASLTVEAPTSILLTNTWYPLAGTWLTTDLQHFDSPANGQLRHLGNTPRDYEVTASLVLESAANDSISVKLRKWDDATSAFVELEYTTLTRVVNNLQGGRNVAYFTLNIGLTLDLNDYMYVEVRHNEVAVTDIEAEIGSFFRIQER